MEIKRDNPRGFENLLGKLKELNGIETKIGWFPSARYEDGTQVAGVAATQEFGSGPIPPRPYFRPTIAEQKANWSNNAAQGAKAVLNGKLTGFQVMDGLGELAQEDVKETINQITSPPLSPITLELRAMKHKNPNLKITASVVRQVAAKVNLPGYQLASGTSDKPLIDSRLLITTLTHTTETA
jgi:hypothetical protein